MGNARTWLDVIILLESQSDSIYAPLQSNLYPNNHQQNLPNGIQQVLAEFIISPDSYREEALADLSEEVEHLRFLRIVYL